MASVALSAGVRNALSSLTSIGAGAQEAQNRLATGKRVNSAVDNAVNFFTSAALNDRAGQFSNLLDGISNGIQTIQAASKGIDAITKLVQSAQSTIKQAQGDATARPSFTSAASLATAASVTATGKTAKEVALASELGGAAATAATATTAAQLGIGAAATANIAITIKAGDTTYTDSTLDETSTVQDLVTSINKSGIATASVGDDGKLTIKATTSEKLQVGIAGSTTAALAETASKTATNGNTLIGLIGVDATTGKEPEKSAVRDGLIKQYNDLRTQIDQLAKDSGYNGINLLGGDKLSVIFNEKTGANQNKLDVQGQSIDSDTLGIKAAGTDASNTNFQYDGSLAKAADSLTSVLSTLRTTASTFGSSLGVVQARQDFSKDLISTLKAGADNLVLADTNDEGAKLLALQTRQQLSQTALTLSNQADQAVLRLF
jgi:flagellin-like hook-associated protein FlgL